MYMGSLENCEFKMDLGAGFDVLRIYGITEDGKEISPSSPQSFEIKGNHVTIETFSGNHYHLLDVVNNETFMKELQEAVDRKQYLIC